MAVDPGQFAQFGVNGLVLGSLLTLGAVGLSLVYGVLRLANFAHGDTVTAGTYLALMLFTMTALGWGGAFTAGVLFAAAALLLAVPFVRAERRRGWYGAGVVLVVLAAALFRSGADVLAWQWPAAGLAASAAGAAALALAPLLVLALRRRAHDRPAPSPAYAVGVASGLAATALLHALAPAPLTVSAAEGVAAACLLGALVPLARRVRPFPSTAVALYATGALAAGLGTALLAWGFRPGLLLALVFAAVVAAGLAVGLDLVLWRPLRRRGGTAVAMLIVSIGLALVVRHVLAVVFGGGIVRYPLPSTRAHAAHGFQVTDAQVAVLLLALLLAAGTHLMLRHTRLGRAMRALADNESLARVTGVHVERVVLVTWGLAAGLAAVAGVLFGVGRSFTPNLGFSLLLLLFASVILGGLGSAWGAMVGAMLIGLATELSVLVVPVHYKEAVAFALMIAVLLVRPRGLAGGAP